MKESCFGKKELRKEKEILNNIELDLKKDANNRDK